MAYRCVRDKNKAKACSDALKKAKADFPAGYDFIKRSGHPVFEDNKWLCCYDVYPKEEAPPPGAPSHQFYDIDGTPSGADIYEGLMRHGRAPMSLQLPYTSHHLTFRRKGYGDMTMHVGTRPGGELITIRYTLEREAAPPPPKPPAPPAPPITPWDAFIAVAHPLFGLGPFIGRSGLLDTIFEAVTGKKPTKEDVIGITGAAATWWPAFNIVSKSIYGTDLKTGEPATAEDITPEELAIAIIDFATAVITGGLIVKLGKAAATSMGVRVGSKALGLAEATLVTELGRTAPAATAGLSGLLKIPSAKSAILILASAMGIDAWAVWAATDNVATLVTMNIREIRDRVEDGSITMEEGLKQLDEVMVYFNEAKRFVDVSQAVNPILWVLAPTFKLNMDLATEVIKNMREQVETLVPGVPSDLRTNINNKRDIVETKFHNAKAYIDDLKWDPDITDAKIAQGNKLIQEIIDEANLLISLLNDNKDVLVSAGVFDTHITWANSKLDSADTQSDLLGMIERKEELVLITKFDITTSPGEVIVTAADVEVGVTDSAGKLVVEVTPGFHSFTFRKEGYRDRIVSKSISEGETLTISLALTLVEEEVTTGTLIIDSVPGSVDVYLAENLIGLTDAAGHTEIELEAFSGDVTFRKMGYEDETDYIILEAGKEARHTVELKPVEELVKAWRVTFIAKNPVGETLLASVFINGSFAGTGTAVTKNLFPGSYTIRFEAFGFVSKEEPLELAVW